MAPPGRDVARAQALTPSVRLVFGLMVVFFLAFGWFALVQDRVAIGGSKGRGGPAVLEGASATAFAFGSFLVAAALGALALRLAVAPRIAYVCALLLVFFPPLVFFYWRG